MGSLNSSCQQSDGTAFIDDVSNEVTSYTALWEDNNTTGDTYSAVPSGSYSVTVTDANGCTSSNSVSVVDDAAPVVTVGLESPASCFGACDGEIVLSIYDGAPTYEINVDPPPCGTTNPIFTGINSGETVTITGLLAGVHAITVKDINGCTDLYYSVTLEPALLEVAIAFTDPLCFGSADGTTTTTVTGGNTSFTYVWDPALTGSANETTASNGLYTVTVTDDKGCEATNEVTLTGPTEVVASITDANDPLCFGDANGSLTVEYAGGTPNYDIQWTNGIPITNYPMLTHQQTGLASGCYTVIITDANNCAATAYQCITDAAIVEISISTITDVTCQGFCDGTADAVSTGGVGTHTYLWSNGETTSSVSNLCAATYTVTTTDANGCYATTELVITEPFTLATTTTLTHASCYSNCDGAIGVEVSGGVTPYNYAWSNTLITKDQTDLCEGTYTLTITDNYGCSASITETLLEPVETIIVTSNTLLSTCGQADGEGEIVVTQGIGPWSYDWGNGTLGTTLSNVPEGSYCVTVSSQTTGCTASQCLSINEEQGPVVTIIAFTDTDCATTCNGSASATVTGGNPVYYPQWPN